MKYASLLLAGICLAPASCIFHAGDTCDGNDCADNQPPEARIRGVDATGNLRVGAHTIVLISAADSSDPDQDVLSYAWQLSPGCSGNVVGAADGVDLRLSDLSPDTDCSVELEVSDGKAQASAGATLTIRDVGAHVSATQPCIAAYDAASNTPQGTPAEPFCKLVDALAAAADYQLAEASLATDAPHLIGGVLIARSVGLRGGYTRGPGPWQANAGGRSDLRITSGAQQANAPVASVRVHGASTNDTVTIANLSIYRIDACIGECALIDADGSNLALTDVDLGSSATTPAAVVSTAAATTAYIGVRLTGIDDGPRVALAMTRVASTGAKSGFASVGVAIRDNVDAVINSCAITELAHTVTAVQLLNAADVRIAASAIIAKSDAATDADARVDSAIAIGVTDGNAGTLDNGSCDADATSTCGSSERLTLSGVTIDVGRARLGIGVGAFGTRTLIFEGATAAQRSTINVQARQAFGIATMAVGNSDKDIAGMQAEGVTLNVSATAAAGTPSAVAFGWSDGYEVPQPDVVHAAVGLGSYGMTMRNAQVSVKVGSQNMNDVAGVVLRDSRQIDLTNLAVSLAADAGVVPPNGWTVDRVAGVRLLRAQEVNLTAGSIQTTQLAGAWTMGGLIDGQMNAGNDDIATDVDGVTYGSTSLSVSGTVFAGVLSIHRFGPTDHPLRTCLGLFGTVTASIMSQSIDCQLGTSENEGTPTMAEIVSIQTRDVTIANSNLVLSAAAATPAVRLVGIQDGARQATDLGSNGLRITRNVIDLQADSTLAVGIRISGVFDQTSGSVVPRPTFVDNNFIHIANSEANLGVLAQATAATIAFNSVRVDSCTLPVLTCLSSYAVGFYLMHVARAAPLELLANGFSVPDTSYGNNLGDSTPLAVEHFKTGASLGVNAMTDNVYGSDLTASGTALLVRFQNDETDPQSPEGQPALDETGINALSPDTALHNLGAPPLYCSDNIHGDPDGPQARWAINVGATELPSPLPDIDNEVRTLPGSDAGADLTGLCLIM